MAAYYNDRMIYEKRENRKRVVVTGIGAVTPLGNNVDDTWKKLVAGVSGIGPITLFNSSTYPVKIAAEVKDFDFSRTFPKELEQYLGRGTQFCIQAANEAFARAGLCLGETDLTRIGISLGANEEYAGISMFDKLFESEKILELLQLRKDLKELYVDHPHLKNATALGSVWPIRRGAYMAATILSILFNIKGPVNTTSSACASSGQSMGKALRMIQDGDADIVVTGGCDSMINEQTITGFYRLGALSKHNVDPGKASRPFDLRRDGFIIGEGSGILIFEELSHAKKRNAPILAEISGYGSSSNAYKITASPETGAGADISMKAALEDADCSFEDIDYINAHGTSTYLNDKSETKALKNVFADKAYSIPVSSNKSMLGHLIASSASIELITSILTIRDNLIPPTINYEHPDPECDLDYVPNEARKRDVDRVLSNSFAFGGQNASVLISRH